MTQASHPYWRRKQPSATTRNAVLQALECEALRVREVAKAASLPKTRACAALDALLIAGRVERLESGEYRRVER